MASIDSTGRSTEEIDEILTAAKLDRKDLLPVSQEIAFAPSFSATEYRLIELPKNVAESIQVGSRLVFRGETNEHAVLCTEGSTFEIKEAETSNSLLIFEELAFPEKAQRTSRSSDSSASSKSPDSISNLPVIPFSTQSDQPPDEEVLQDTEVVVRTIEGIVHSYFELKKITPNLSRIRNILAATPYKGSTETECDTENLTTLEKLLETVPASAEEIEGYLQSIRVIEHEGFLRLVDDEYLFRVFSLVAGLVDENSWSPDSVEKSVTISTLSSLEPIFILEHIFEWFFHKNTELDNDDIYSMKEDRVCRFFGETLLKPVGRFNLSEFMKVWEQSVPEGLKVNLKQLDGVAVHNTQCSPSVIWHFPEYNLPDVTLDRFAVLFEAKPKWKLEEITPFLRNLPSSQSVGILLTKYGRVNTVNGVKFYSSKHLK